MLWKVPEADLSLVIDPIASDLTFGLPLGLFHGKKKVLSEQATLNMIVDANPSHCVISQVLDDHCHLETLTKLLQRMPRLKFIVAPSVKEKLETIVDDKTSITVISPGESIPLTTCTASGVECQLMAVEGSLVGPPWQARENAYVLTTTSDAESRSIFYEPHADVQDETLDTIHADVVIAPVKRQTFLGFYPIIYGADRALPIVDKLHAQVLIVLRNGEIETEGALNKLITTSGSVDDFVEQNANESLCIERPKPGEPLTIRLQ